MFERIRRVTDGAFGMVERIRWVTDGAFGMVERIRWAIAEAIAPPTQTDEPPTVATPPTITNEGKWSCKECMVVYELGRHFESRNEVPDTCPECGSETFSEEHEFVAIGKWSFTFRRDELNPVLASNEANTPKTVKIVDVTEGGTIVYDRDKEQET